MVEGALHGEALVRSCLLSRLLGLQLRLQESQFAVEYV